MVERLKNAVAKARAMREQGSNPGSLVEAPKKKQANVLQRRSNNPASNSDAVWGKLEKINLDAKVLDRNRLIAHSRSDPSHAAFDVLRTRVLSVFQKHGWSRLGITSPTKGCGKTFISANLALSFARQADVRTALIDMDLRAPGLAKVLGVPRVDPISWMLSGDVAAEDFLRVAGENLALGLNSTSVRNSAEMIMSDATKSTLDGVVNNFQPDIILYDLPPMLVSDDVLGFLPNLDCVLLIAGGGTTRPADVTECERLLMDQTHLLGVVMNKAEDAVSSQYGYGAD